MKNKNKISIKQVKGLQKNFLQHFFRGGGGVGGVGGVVGAGGGGVYFCFVIVWSDIEV